jgi:hypothetical protein
VFDCAPGVKIAIGKWHLVARADTIVDSQHGRRRGPWRRSDR